VLGIRADWNDRWEAGVSITGNLAIGGKGSLFSRALHGTCKFSGNQFQVQYGSLRPFNRVPPFRLTLYSTKTSLTAGQVIGVVRSLFRPIQHAYVAELELTFDLSPDSQISCDREIFSCARRFLKLKDERGHRTFYAGARTSSWQFKQYKKPIERPIVSRFEFTFRRSFLRKHRISAPHHVQRLSQFDLAGLVRFRSISETALRAALSDMDDDCRKRDLLDWPPRKPLRDLARILRSLGIDPEPLFHDCAVEKRIRRMQERLIF
jgi:hypothetical protein